MGLVRPRTHGRFAAALTMEARRASEMGIVMIGSLKRHIVITRRYARKQTKRTRNLTGRLSDVLGGLGTMKALGRQARFQVLNTSHPRSRRFR